MVRRTIVLIGLTLLLVTSLHGDDQLVQAAARNGGPVLLEIGLTGSVHRVHGVADHLDELGVGQALPAPGADTSRMGKVLESYADLLRVAPSSIGPTTVSTDGSNWFVSATQEVDGIPVHGTELGFTVDRLGYLVALGADAYPEIAVSTVALVEQDAALELALSELGDHGLELKQPGELVIYPRETAVGFEFHLAWKLTLGSLHPLRQEDVFVDAESGAVLEVVDTLRDSSVSGRVSGHYWPKHYYDSTVYAYFPTTDIRLYSIAGQLVRQANTNSSGYYSMSGFAYGVYIILFRLQDSYIQIRGSSGNEVTSSFAVIPGTVNKNWGANNGSNVRWHADVMHDYFKNSFAYTGMDYQSRGYVDQGPGINGQADGNHIYFGSDSGRHWARSSDVVYHEYTHNTIYHVYGGWIGSDYYAQGRAMDEGLSDYFACTKNNDSILGESVGVNRNLSNSYTWNASAGAHWNGQVIGGACWDVRSATGASVADTLSFRALQVTPRARDFNDLLTNMIVADNTHFGGSHRSAVISAFANHGISLPALNVSISGPSRVGYWEYATWTANASGGSPGYHYEWWYRYPENLPYKDGSKKPPRGFWFQIGSDSPQLTRRDNENFELKCVVTDSIGSEVTSNIKYVTVLVD